MGWGAKHFREGTSLIVGWQSQPASLGSVRVKVGGAARGESLPPAPSVPPVPYPVLLAPCSVLPVPYPVLLVPCSLLLVPYQVLHVTYPVQPVTYQTTSNLLSPDSTILFLSVSCPYPDLPVPCSASKVPLLLTCSVPPVPCIPSSARNIPRHTSTMVLPSPAIAMITAQSDHYTYCAQSFQHQ